MSFVVSTLQFDGPLDLMLHLIREKQLDILNLDLAVLAEQYIDYIHQMEKQNLDISSEYLVEMANLIEYKSKQLLPKNKDELEGEYEEDKQNNLVQRLLEYQRYKEITNEFERMYQERMLLHDKPQSTIADSFKKNDENEVFDNTSPYELIKAMKRVLNRYKLQNPYEISLQTQRISVDDRRKQLKVKIGKYQDVFTLAMIMDDCKDTYDVVVTFLSILQMVNENEMAFTVKKDEIYFKKV